MILVGMDDTDNGTSRGTGRLARQIAQNLRARFRIAGITRHQLLVDPRIPYTSHNSSATIHLLENGRVNLDALADDVQQWMLADWQDGSDPGLCVARSVPTDVSDFGRRAQTSLVTQAEALALAERHGLALRGLGGTCDGVIGALAGVGLAATGNDGRFIQIGTARELQGFQPLVEILSAGIAEVRTRDGQPLHDGVVDTHDKLRPAFREGQPILFVERSSDSQHCWVCVKLD